jgi:hypothetical protein
LHLSARDGIPMHAVENGWYWYRQSEWQNLTDHLRITVPEIPSGLSKGEFTKWIDAMRPRWKREADAAIRKHEL